MFVCCLCVADLPTCLLCVCLTRSVYCEEVSPDMTAVPTLPKETAYLYARFNKIKKISAKDFSDIGKSGKLPSPQQVDCSAKFDYPLTLPSPK